MTDKKLHIVSFDVPFPANYGGVIDIFYKIKSLYESGIKITLHCFDYGRGKRSELENYCGKVFYYERKTGKHLLFHRLPYIVAGRSSEEVIKNLLLDDAPVLFEGLHCCFYLNDGRLKNRKKIVRTHNIEQHYYAQLALAEKSFFRRKYLKQEAKKLKKFESVLKYADAIGAISPADASELSLRYKNVSNIMAFHPHDKVEIKSGGGNFALYHGSLSVGENNKAALYLVNEVFNNSNIPLVIAGKGASADLKNSVKNKNNIQLKEHSSIEEIYSLIQNAQVNILPTFQATGIKLKLLAALFTGRHCIVNSPMVVNTGLESLCHIADTPQEMKRKTSELMTLKFPNEDRKVREKILGEKFYNKKNADKLIELLW